MMRTFGAILSNHNNKCFDKEDKINPNDDHWSHLPFDCNRNIFYLCVQKYIYFLIAQFHCAADKYFLKLTEIAWSSLLTEHEDGERQSFAAKN